MIETSVWRAVRRFGGSLVGRPIRAQLTGDWVEGTIIGVFLDHVAWEIHEYRLAYIHAFFWGLGYFELDTTHIIQIDQYPGLKYPHLRHLMITLGWARNKR